MRADLLAHLGVKAGEKLQFEKLPDGQVRIRRGNAAHSLADPAGMLKPPSGIRLTIGEMNAIIARNWAGELCE